MLNGRPRKVVVLKNIPSNTIEEAILILKNDMIYKDPRKAGEVMSTNKRKDSSFILREAEMIINNYIKESKGVKKPSDAAYPESRQNKQGNSVNIGINMALIASIALLIFIISRLI